MNKLLILFTLITSAYGYNCQNNPIFCQIIENSPKINKKYAMRLSNAIYRSHKKHKIPTDIYTAILKQESNYNLKAKGCHVGIEQENHGIVETEVCSDFGISQIYFRTAKRLNIDIPRLTEDLGYSVDAGARVLSGFMKKYSKNDPKWWNRYNCGSRGSTNRDTCQIYDKLVRRYMSEKK